MSDPSTLDLPTRWPLPGRHELRDRLLAAYGEERRAYHDLLHLAEVLERVDLLADELPDPADQLAVRLAAWFHDAVYVGAPDDEERSALLASGMLAAAGLALPVVAEVARLVRMTAHHRPDDEDRNGQVLSDADLGILGASPERYAEYVAQVRREYAAVPDDDFRRGRAAILRDLLEKPFLFHTPRARELWEDQARTNVTRELAHLT